MSMRSPSFLGLTSLVCAALSPLACSNSDAPPFDPSPDASVAADTSPTVDAAPQGDTNDKFTPPCGSGACPLGPHDEAVTCVAGVCVPTCRAGAVRCGGRCVPATPANGCGASPSCEPCSAPADATAACEAGRCVFTCALGAVRQGDRCLPLPLLRPRSPANGAAVYARPPRVCYAGLTAPAVAARIDFFDGPGGAVVRSTTTSDACFTVPPEVAVAGRPVWWGVTAVAGAAVGTPSGVWRFFPTTRNGSTGSWEQGVSDLNGDGPGDLLVGLRSGGISLLHGAGDLRLRRAPAALPSADALDDQRTMLLADTDGDRRAEVVAGSPLADGVFVWRNPASSTTPDLTLRAPMGFTRGDGFGASLAVGAFSADAGDGLAVAGANNPRVAVFSNLASGPRAIVLNVGATPQALAAGGVTGGRFDDLAVLAGSRVLLFRGAEEGIRTAPLATITLPAPGVALAVADVLEDGYSDLVVRTATELLVYRGSPTGVSAAAVQRISVVAGTSLVCADLAGDEAPDCAVDLAATGEIAVFRGGSAGLGQVAAFVRSGAGVDRGALRGLVPRDVDGDGRIDLSALALDEKTRRAAVLVWRGAGGALATEPVVITNDGDDPWTAPLR